MTLSKSVKKEKVKWADLASIELVESPWVEPHQIVFWGAWVKNRDDIGGSRKITVYDLNTGKYSGNCRPEEIVRVTISEGRTEMYMALLNKKKGHLVKT